MPINSKYRSAHFRWCLRFLYAVGCYASQRPMMRSKCRS